MFLVHYSWHDENGPAYGGKLVATRDEANTAVTAVEEEFASADARTGDEVEVQIEVTEIDLGGVFAAEI